MTNQDVSDRQDIPWDIEHAGGELPPESVLSSKVCERLLDEDFDYIPDHSSHIRYNEKDELVKDGAAFSGNLIPKKLIHSFSHRAQRPDVDYWQNTVYHELADKVEITLVIIIFPVNSDGKDERHTENDAEGDGGCLDVPQVTQCFLNLNVLI